MTARRRSLFPGRGTLFPRAVCTIRALLAAPLPGPILAQEPVIEEQVALDADGRLLRIDAKLAAALGLFGDVTNVRDVLLFRSPDGYVLEITRRRGGVLVRERRSMTADEVAELRAVVSRRMAERAPSALVDRSVGTCCWARPRPRGSDSMAGRCRMRSGSTIRRGRSRCTCWSRRRASSGRGCGPRAGRSLWAWRMAPSGARRAGSSMASGFTGWSRARSPLRHLSPG